MLRSLALTLSVFAASAVQAQDSAVLSDVVNHHILPRFETLDSTAQSLDVAAQANCSPSGTELRAAYNAAFDAWIAASHLRFGPAEEDDRGYAMGFWPDPKGFTAKSLASLINDEDPIVQDPESYDHVSIAARGFFALEFLLYDDWIQDQGDEAYRCDLIRAVAHDIARNASFLNDDWHNDYGPQFATVGPGKMHKTEDTAVQVLVNALATGLQFTEETRLGRPMGTFERPRPNRAEARRSKRSLRNVDTALKSQVDLALRLSAEDQTLAQTYQDGLARAENRMEDLSPVFAGVADPGPRLKVEILQQEVHRLRETTNTTLASHWGVAVGFNALDGD